MRIPYFNFYPTDFMKGVRGLTPQEVGIYVMLLCRIYEENGPIAIHPGRMAAYCGCSERLVAKVIDRLVYLGRLTISEGMISDDRAEVEIAKRENALKSQSRAGEISAQKRKQNQRQASTGVQRDGNHTDTDTDKSSVANATDGVAVDFAKQLFERAVAFLGRHGVKEAQARSFVGRLRKSNADPDIFAAFVACGKAGAIDPIPWITANLTGKLQPISGGSSGKPSRNTKRLNAFLAASGAAPGLDFGQDCNPSQPLLDRR